MKCTETKKKIARGNTWNKQNGKKNKWKKYTNGHATELKQNRTSGSVFFSPVYNVI